MSENTVKERLKAGIDLKRCDGAPGCPARKICSKEAIVPEKELSVTFTGFPEFNVYKVDDDICTGCGKCVAVCPRQAINIVPCDQ